MRQQKHKHIQDTNSPMLLHRETDTPGIIRLLLAIAGHALKQMTLAQLTSFSTTGATTAAEQALQACW